MQLTKKIKERTHNAYMPPPLKQPTFKRKQNVNV